MTKILDPQEKENQFNRFLISEYLKYGSVEEVFSKNHYDLPISFMGVHRLLSRWQIVKAAGPNTRLSEALAFLTRLSYEKIPLERLYRNMPPSFKTSMATLHRILSLIRKETIRRVGTALVITPEDHPNLVLIGKDISTPRPELGKPFGSLSLPMGYSSRTESRETSILRVLQQEVFTQQAISKSMPNVIPLHPEPFIFFDIVDVRVAVYHLVIAKDLWRQSNFSSFKLTEHKFIDASNLSANLSSSEFRTGVREIVAGYRKYLSEVAQNPNSKPIFAKSFLNQELAAVVGYSY